MNCNLKYLFSHRTSLIKMQTFDIKIRLVQKLNFAEKYAYEDFLNSLIF